MSISTRRPARRSLAGAALVSFLAGVVGLAAMPASGAPGDELLPDLVSEPVGDPDGTAGTDTVGGDTRLLLRFTGYIRNQGPGPLRITGENPTDGKISGAGLRQVITHEDGSRTGEARPGAELLFENTDLHNHWHFQRAARYSLWNEAKGQETGVSTKVGFCFLDISRVGADAADPAFSDECRRHDPELTRGPLEMGVSRGWRDVYEKTLPFQYVDVSNTRPGHYWLHSEIDPENLIREASELNAGAFATRRSTVPGYVARSASGVPVGAAPSPVTLSADAFGTGLGAIRYSIIEGPRHGQLTTPAPDGEGWFAGSQVSYRSSGAYNGCDSFRFAAKQGGSGFPLAPAAATVTLRVGSGDCTANVAISGAPEFLFAGEGVQLGASAPGSVTWTVNDVAGGNSQVGTITSGGLYRAPDAVPAAGKVKVSAVAGNGARDDVQIGIRARRKSGPTPDVPSPRTPSAKRKPLSKPVIGRNGRLLVVKFTPGRTGRLKVRVVRPRAGGSVKVAVCEVRVVRARPATCRFRLEKAAVPRLKGKISVYGVLTAKGHRVATRRSTVSLAKKPNARYIGPICILTP